MPFLHFPPFSSSVTSRNLPWPPVTSCDLGARIWPKTAISEEKFNRRPKGRQMADICSRDLPAGIWTKTAVSQWSQKRNSIADRRAAKWQKVAPMLPRNLAWPTATSLPYRDRHRHRQTHSTVHFTLYTLHSTLHSLHFTLYTLHSTLYTLHLTHYTLH